MGKLSGYDLFVLDAEFSDITKKNPWRVPDGVLKTNDLEKVFSARTQFSLDSIAALVAGVTALMVKEPEEYARQLRAGGVDPGAVFMPFMLRRLVTRTIQERGLPDTVGREAELGWLHRAEAVLFQIGSLEDDKVSKGNDTDVQSLAMRGMQAQYHDQLSYFDYMRELWITKRTIAEAMNLSLDLEEAFRSRFSITWSQLASLCFFGYAEIVRTAGRPVDAKSFASGGGATMPTDAIQAFLDLVSCSYEDFQSHARNPSVSFKRFETYALSPLVYYPLLRLSDGVLVCPILTDLLDRATRSFREDCRRLSGVDQGRLNQAVGAAYEAYVEAVLTGARGVGEMLRASDVLPRAAKNCDFISIEGGHATLIEAKSVNVALSTEMTKDEDHLRAELNKEGGLADGLIQINETAKCIRAGGTKVQRRAILNGLLVARGEQAMLNWPLVRDILSRIVKERSGRELILSFQIANDSGLDLLAQLVHGGASLGQFLYHKRKDPHRNSTDIHAAVSAYSDELGKHPLSVPLRENLDEIVRICVPAWPPEVSGK